MLVCLHLYCAGNVNKLPVFLLVILFRVCVDDSPSVHSQCSFCVCLLPLRRHALVETLHGDVTSYKMAEKLFQWRFFSLFSHSLLEEEIENS